MTVKFKSQIYNLIILLYVYERVPRVSVSLLLLLCVLLVHLLSVGAIDDSLLLMVFWILTGLSVLGLFSQRYGLQPLTIALIIRSIYHLGLGNTLILLGSLNVRHTPAPIIHPNAPIRAAQSCQATFIFCPSVNSVNPFVTLRLCS